MAHQQHPHRTPRYGSGRDIHTHIGSHSATYSTLEPQTRFRTSPNSANTSRHRDSGDNRRSYRQNVFDDDSGSDGEAHDYSPYQHGQHTAQQGHPDRYEVHRSWRLHNPEVDRVLGGQALREAIDRLEGRVSRHNRSSSRQLHPTHTDRHHSPDQYQTSSRPLGYSNLRNLNESRSPQHPMERRLREDQWSGQYDAVYSVGRQSDYDGRGRHVPSNPNAEYGRRYEDEEYEVYDDRRSRNYY